MCPSSEYSRTLFCEPLGGGHDQSETCCLKSCPLVRMCVSQELPILAPGAVQVGASIPAHCLHHEIHKEGANPGPWFPHYISGQYILAGCLWCSLYEGKPEATALTRLLRSRLHENELAALRAARFPKQIISGRHDPCISPCAAKRLASAINCSVTIAGVLTWPARTC